MTERVDSAPRKTYHRLDVDNHFSSEGDVMTRRRILLLFPCVVCCLVIFSGCLTTGGSLQQAGTAPVFNRMVRAELIFGLSSPDGPITEQNWQSFLDEIITPRFRDGLTVIDVSGQWLNKSGKLEREKDKMVLILFDPTPTSDQALEEIRASYKQRIGSADKERD
ncbi:MAG: DUF3574 domain-containing protein [Deltaproteobacteria bacterium]|nr:DUF3574 domain-containing protein [Deltaproteobacteria bacterium]